MIEKFKTRLLIMLMSIVMLLKNNRLHFFQVILKSHVFQTDYTYMLNHYVKCKIELVCYETKQIPYRNVP